MEVCGVSREAARAALKNAGGSVKLAIVMARRKVDAAEGQRLLEAAGGFVRAVVGDPPAVTI
jgi:N-acetylmuramic acid 6-phosphate etherase